MTWSLSYCVVSAEHGHVISRKSVGEMEAFELTKLSDHFFQRDGQYSYQELENRASFHVLRWFFFLTCQSHYATMA